MAQRNAINPDLLLHAYKIGVFPMAFHDKSPDIQWICPQMRGQLSITDLHISRSLKKTIKKNIKSKHYAITINTNFKNVIDACAQINDHRRETWINTAIIDSFCALHDQGYAHSVECWEGQNLVGGLYGIAIGAAFFGESMFSRQSNTSKIALVHLVARLWHQGFKLLDTQFSNDHLEQFGVYEIPHEDYIERLTPLLKHSVSFENKDIEDNEIVARYLEMRSE